MFGEDVLPLVEDMVDSVGLEDLADLVGLEDLEDLVGLGDLEDLVALEDLEDLVGVCDVLQEYQAIEPVDLVDGVCSDLLEDLQDILLLWVQKEF